MSEHDERIKNIIIHDMLAVTIHAIPLRCHLCHSLLPTDWKWTEVGISLVKILKNCLPLHSEYYYYPCCKPLQK